GKGCHNARFGLPFRDADGANASSSQHIGICHVGHASGRGSRRARSIVGQGHLGGEAAFIGVAVSTGNGEGATDSRHRAGGGGAVTPINRGRKVRGRIPWITAVVKERHRAAKG